MKIFKVILTVILLIFLLIPGDTYAQNKVLDGNFEEDTPFTDPTEIAQQFQIFPTTRPMKYWTIKANSIDKHNKAHWGMGCPPSGLDHHIDINPNGAIEQVITGLSAGTKYNFSFYTSVHYLLATGCGTSGGTATAKVSVGSMFTVTLNLGTADAPWTKRSYSFTATASTAILRFEGINSCYGN